MGTNFKRQIPMAGLLLFLAAQAATAAISPSGLVGYYPFDGNGNDLNNLA
jgi:hypothetical protein